jgi:amino acid adenylation domain-containing protein
MPANSLNPDGSLLDLRSEQCVPQLVQAQATDVPSAVALVCGNQRVNYRELNARADALSHRLRSLGVGPNVPVGLCMERSVDLPIGALGILKAGGAYVPLDPSYPSQRLTLLLEDSGTSVVVTQSAVAARIPVGKWQTIVLDEDKQEGPLDSALSPDGVIRPENLAYVIFTSGSTGRPKGVKISHGNLLNLVRWHQRAFSVTATDRATLQSSPGFDAAVWEIWPYLASGASLYLVDETVRASPDALRDWILSCGITISFLPTVLAEKMIALKWPEKTPLRTLLTGAETLRRRPPEDLPFALVNNYGPTECTVVATSGKVSPTGLQDELPSIGAPIDNITVYIVDENMQPVPSGTAGELLIGGRGVGQGYINSPERTANSFLPDSFSGGQGARLYRTGDSGRLLPDGQIAYLGRLDDQIKIRGHRIEPNEIVTALDQHPHIETSFACSYPDDSGNQRLVAYIVTAKNLSPKPGELRDFLSTKLPSYMVPSTFVQLTHLPRSVNGKMDRSALPRPSAENTLRDDLGDSPQSPIEKHLAVLLSGLLAVPCVGREDNFFTLGGHSLMAAQLIAKIRESFGVELTLRNLFEQPTVRGMSDQIEQLIHARLAAMSEDEAQQLLASSEGI